MGLTMREKKALTNEIAVRYRAESKNGKQAILDEFCRSTGYHRKYAMHLLNTWGKKKIHVVDGKLVEFVVGKPRKRKKRTRECVYDEALQDSLRKLWELFDYQCGKRLVVLIRANMEVLKAEPEFEIDEEIAVKLCSISASTVDRLLKSERRKLELKGRSHTRHGPLLKHQIPIRTHFTWDERLPGYFELDTVHHDGGSASGEYCATLTATDVFSGWTELRPLRNRAHRWVKERVIEIRSELPFSLLGVDSDNGGEFINKALLNYCNDTGITFTRGRPYRKNDNCFVEQKNDIAVRRTVGYYRFDTDAEYEALQDVYTHLCPLLNYFYASAKLVEKIRIGPRVKKVYETPKPPYQRLLDSPLVSDDVKNELRRRVRGIHIVKQKRLVDQAITKLLRIRQDKNQLELPIPCSSTTTSGKIFT
ncbi:MAG: transposase [Spirochaetaceae bacterium]|nr:MAG: transposase [Spirochaetaceae bacterium]